jgi:hypothetical protein
MMGRRERARLLAGRLADPDLAADVGAMLAGLQEVAASLPSRPEPPPRPGIDWAALEAAMCPDESP